MPRVQRWFFVLVLLCFFFALHSQSMVVLDIQVSGQQRIDRDLILATSGIRIGEALTAEAITNAIRSLYQLNIFDDVDITVSEAAAGVRVHIAVVELPAITRLSYNGNSALSNSRLDEVGVLRVGTYWSGIVEAENTKRILAEYRLKGYNLAKLDYIVRPSGDGVSVRVDVDEGKKIVVRRIAIMGNREIATNRITKKMKTKPRGLLRTGTFDNDKYQADLKAIIDLYNAEGFIDARIVKTEESIADDRFLTLSIFIEEGLRYTFGKIDVRGNSHFDRHAILGRFTMKEGDIFNMEQFNRQLGQVGSMYYEEGYIYFNVDPQISKVGSAVNIMLDITENTRAKIHKVHISGNTKTKEKIIRRQLTIAPGDYFRQSRVIRSQQNVYNLGFFEPNMDLDYQPINTAGDVDLFLNVVDKGAGSANGGVGYNSRDGVVGQLSFSHSNLWGNYWQVNARYELSGVTQNIELDFTNPYLWDTDILFGFNVYSTRREWSDFYYRVQTDGGGVRLGYPIKILDYTRVVGGYSLYGKEYSPMGNANNASQSLQTLFEQGRQYTSAVNLTFSRDSRDNIFFPRTGSRMVLYNELAGGYLGGDFNYYKQIAEVSWFTPVFWEVVLRSKYRMGFIEGYGEGARGEVPPDERFYLGGTGPDGIRGYGDRSIYPESDTGRREGGKRSILYSTELGIPISSDQLVGLLFFDTGNCFNNFSDFNFKEFKKGTGAGMRIRTPFGLIGFDFAYNLDEKVWEPHFQFGTTF